MTNLSTNTTNFCNTIPEICSIALQAGDAILQCYQREYEVTKKEDCSPLTEADLNANSIITTRLRESENSDISSIPLLSEENAIAPFEERSKWDLLWIVDPLDGTKEFINKNDEFTVNIGLVQNGQAVAGVLLVPALKQLYFAVVGVGAYRLDLNSVSESKIADADFSHLVETATELGGKDREAGHCIVIGSRSHGSDEFQEFVSELQADYSNIETISAGSSLKFCRVAEGDADIYPRLGRTMEWDTCAGHAIVRAVGKKVFIYGSEEELSYNKADLANPWFIVR